MPITQTIDATGGAITSSDGRLSVTIPAGALAVPTDVTIQPITNTAPDGDTSAINYRLQPEGTAFAVPVTLTFHLDDYEVEAIDGMFIATQGADGFWDAQPGLTGDATAKTVSVTTTHFSDWALLQTLMFFPRFSLVHTGATESFRVLATNCSPRPCQTFGVDLAAAQAVCSVAAGSVTASTDRCRFTAPASVPSPNPVIIKVRIGLGAHVGIAVARAKITTEEKWYGSWQVSDSGTGYTYYATVTFNQTDSDLSVLDRHFNVDELSWMTANPPASIAPCSISPLNGRMGPDDGDLEVDYTGSQDNPKVSTTGGKTLWPVSVTCEGHSYPALLGGLWLAPDQTFANNGQVKFTINKGTLTGTATLQRNY